MRIAENVSWTKMKYNVDVLNQVGEKGILLIAIKERSGEMCSVCDKYI